MRRSPKISKCCAAVSKGSTQFIRTQRDEIVTLLRGDLFVLGPDLSARPFKPQPQRSIVRAKLPVDQTRSDRLAAGRPKIPRGLGQEQFHGTVADRNKKRCQICGKSAISVSLRLCRLRSKAQSVCSDPMITAHGCLVGKTLKSVSFQIFARLVEFRGYSDAQLETSNEF